MRWRGAILVVLAGLVPVRPAHAQDVRLMSVKLEHPVIAIFERCELTMRVNGKVNNPYDPEELSLEATFQPPRDRPITVAGFYYQGFEQASEHGQETLRPSGEPVWKVRFTPRSLGHWSYRVRMRTRAGVQSVPGGTFDVVEGAGRGFVQLDRTTGMFRWEKGGELFIPVGENLSWPPSTQPLRTYTQWFQELSQQQANYIRVWMAPWFLRLETKATGVGRYDQMRAWQLDYLFEQSRKRGLYWQLCLLDHGSFSRSQDTDWNNNPYNAQLGGMCRVPNEFATHPRAKALFRQLLHYMVSRWGDSPQLVSWELFNEANYSDIRLEDLTPWIKEMSAWLHEVDVNRRPVTISFHQTSPVEVWRIPTIDLIQWHVYDEHDFTEAFCTPRIAQLKQAFGKPVMVGEFGWTAEFMRKIDRVGVHLHDGLWSSLMGGAVGGALIWYWDSYVHPNHLQRLYRPLARFWHGEQSFNQHSRPLALSFSDPDLVGCGVEVPHRAYFWIKNRTHNLDHYLAYQCELAKQRLRTERGQATLEQASYPPRVVEAATVTIGGLDWMGRYRVEWWDPYNGTVLTRSTSSARGGKLTLEVPRLAFDVAAKLIRLRWWESG